MYNWLGGGIEWTLHKTTNLDYLRQAWPKLRTEIFSQEFQQIPTKFGWVTLSVVFHYVSCPIWVWQFWKVVSLFSWRLLIILVPTHSFLAGVLMWPNLDGIWRLLIFLLNLLIFARVGKSADRAFSRGFERLQPNLCKTLEAYASTFNHAHFRFSNFESLFCHYHYCRLFSGFKVNFWLKVLTKVLSQEPWPIVTKFEYDT